LLAQECGSKGGINNHHPTSGKSPTPLSTRDPSAAFPTIDGAAITPHDRGKGPGIKAETRDEKQGKNREKKTLF